MYFRYFVIISLSKRGVALHLQKLNPLYPRMLCIMFGWNWSGWNVKRQKDGRRTIDNQKSYTFSSGAKIPNKQHMYILHTNIYIYNPNKVQNDIKQSKIKNKSEKRKWTVPTYIHERFQDLWKHPSSGEQIFFKNVFLRDVNYDVMTLWSSLQGGKNVIT